MLPRVALIVLTAALFAVPVGHAQPACAKTPPTDQTLTYPLNSDVYLVINGTADTGFWTETNGVGGLQTHACTDSNGLLWYDADTFQALSPGTSELFPGMA